MLNPAGASGRVLEFSGSGSVLTVAGDIVVNGGARNAGTTIVGGEVGATGAFEGNWPSNRQTLDSREADPFENANPGFTPDCTPNSNNVAAGQTVGPGTYNNLAAGSGTITLEAGFYSITGRLSASSAGIIQSAPGAGVTLYFCPTADISMSGTLRLRAPGGSTGFAIFFDRGNTRSIGGSGFRMDIIGVVYARSANLDTSGSGTDMVIEGDLVIGRIDNVSGGGNLTIRRAPSGSLHVIKSITGPGGRQHGPITIDVTCGTTPLSPPINIPAGSFSGAADVFPPVPYHNIPVGVTCRVTEPLANDGSTPQVQVGTTVAPANGVMITGTGIPAIVVDNVATLRPGSLLVTKTITGPAAGQQGQIVIGVSCTGAPPQPDFVIPAGVTGTREQPYPNIPADSRCTATETSNGHTSTVAVAVEGGGETTIPAGGQASLGMTNTVSSTPGTLIVNKTITGPAAGHQGALAIRVTCNGTRLPDFTIPARAAAGSRSHTYSGLTPGQTCTLSEAPDGHTSSVNVRVMGDRRVTLPAGGAATASLVDTYTGVPGRLRVEKTIGGPAAGSQGTVRIGVICDARALPDLVIPARTRAGTRSRTYANLPAFARCLVFEARNGHSARIIVAVTGSGQRVTIPANGTATARLTDRFRAVQTQVSGLTVRKTASSRRVVGGNTVRFTLVARNRGSTTATNVQVCDRLPSQLGFLSAPGSRLVSGNVCWTINRLAPGARRSFTVHTQSFRTSVARRVCNRATLRASGGGRASGTACIRVLASRGAPRFTG